MALVRVPFHGDYLADRAARFRLVTYGLLGLLSLGAVLVAPSDRGVATLIVVLLVGWLPMLERRDAVRHLSLAFKVDAVGFLALWWLMGPVAGLGVGLFLVAALAGIILPSRDALFVGIWVLGSEGSQVPLHWLAELRDGMLPLLHAPGQVVALGDFLSASAVRLLVLLVTIVAFRSIGASMRRYQGQITESEEAFRGAFEGAPVGVGLVDGEGNLLRANHRLRTVLPALASSDSMRALEDGRSDEVCVLLRSVLDRALEAGYVDVEPVESRFTRVWVSAVHDQEDHFVHAVVHAEDVTDEHAASDRLERLVRSKDEFVAAISHELRTPLTAVVGFSELLRQSRQTLDDDQVGEMIADIARESAEVSSIVEDLLVIARADIGKVTLLPEAVFLVEQVDLVTQNLDMGGRDITVEAGTDAVEVDPVRFRQILRNLVTNAVRYGGEDIRISSRRDGDHLIITVADNGSGIGSEAAERIFEAYERAHEQPSQPASVGLGLAVARSLARAMGGEIDYCRVDGWTRFELTVPTADLSVVTVS